MARSLVNRPKAVGIGVTALSASLAIAVPFIVTLEGESLKAYQDIAGVWTICNGETSGIRQGMVMTREQCQALTKSRVGEFMSQVYALQAVSLNPKTLAAHTSFAYNIGISGYAGSKALSLTNQGKLADGCMAMGNWYTAGKRDCRIQSNNCYGLINRRNKEIALCLEGLK